MASGDANRTWFSEMVETLRQEWKSELSWEQVIALRRRLDAMLQEIRTSRTSGLRRCGARFARSRLSRRRRSSRFELPYSHLAVLALSLRRKSSRWRSAGQSTARKTVSIGMASSARHYPQLALLTGWIVSRTSLSYDDALISEKSPSKREAREPGWLGEGITRRASEHGPR